MTAATNATLGQMTTTAADCTTANLNPVFVSKTGTATTWQCLAGVTDGQTVPDQSMCWANHMVSTTGAYGSTCFVVPQPGSYAYNQGYCTGYGFTATDQGAVPAAYKYASVSTGDYYRCGSQGSGSPSVVADQGTQTRLDTINSTLTTLGGTAHGDAGSQLAATKALAPTTSATTYTPPSFGSLADVSAPGVVVPAASGLVAALLVIVGITRGVGFFKRIAA